MNRLSALLAGGLVLALAGCSAPAPEEVSAPETPAVTSPVISPTPSPPGESDADRQVRIERAALTAADLADTPFRPDEDGAPERQKYALHRCDPPFGAERLSSGGYLASWNDEDAGISVTQYLTGFVRAGAAAELVDQARAELATCDSHVLGDYTVVLLGEQPVADVAESRLAFCEKFGDDGLGWCTMILATGDVLTRLQVLAPSVEAAEPVIASMAALAGPKLAAARSVPDTAGAPAAPTGSPQAPVPA